MSLPYIKHGQAQGPTDRNTFWMLFGDLPLLYEMGIYKNLMIHQEGIHGLCFAITAESKDQREEIGRADCITKASALVDWVLGINDKDADDYWKIDNQILDTIITR